MLSWQNKTALWIYYASLKSTRKYLMAITIQPNREKTALVPNCQIQWPGSKSCHNSQVWKWDSFGNVDITHNKWAVFSCNWRTGIYTGYRLWHVRNIGLQVNHRNLFLDPSVKLDDISKQYDYRSAFPKLVFQNPRFIQNRINSITISHHLLRTSHVPGMVPSVLYTIISFTFHNNPVDSYD